MGSKRALEEIRRVLRVRRPLGRQVERDVSEEIGFHLGSRVDDLMAAGLGRAEAERRAMGEFGDVAAAERALRRESARRERRARRTEWVRELGRDIAFGWRTLRTSPGFTAAAVITLALGIGATTAIFGGVHAVLLRPLPYPAPDRLVKVWETSPEGATTNVVSSGNYMDWREQTTSFSALGAHSWLFGMTLTGEDDPVRLRVVRITPSALDALGAGAVAGRTFVGAEGEPGGEAVAMISHRLWRGRFGGEPGIVGATVTLDGQPHTLVGVMPPSFDYPDPEVDVWRALRFGVADREQRRSHQWNVIGRLADDVPLERARAEMDAVAGRLAQAHPQHMTDWGVNVVPLRADMVGEVRGLLWVLLGVVGVVLLLTCVNLANLLLARATARDREMAVRGALGAARRRLVRQLLVESLLLGVLGGGLALAVLVVGLDGLVALAPPDIPLLDDIRVDPVVLAFAAGTTLLATLLFGLVPALRATAAAPGRALRSSRGSDGPGHGRLRAVLLVTEVALAVVLVVGAGLLLRSMTRLNAVDPGLDLENVLTAVVDIPWSEYGTSEEQVAFYRALLDRVRAMPGVVAAAGTTEPPIIGYANTFSYEIEGRPASTPTGREDDERLAAVTPDYFRTLRIPILEGRAIASTDRADRTPVMVISESLARKQWPGGDALGQRIRFSADGSWFEIIGVAGDARMDGLDRPAPPVLYMAQAQKPWGWLTWLVLTVRTEAEPTALAPAIRDELQALDAAVLPERVATLDQLYAESAARRRFATVLLGAFAVLALVLGATGIYGVLSYAVARRRREIGIRMALGADRGRVARSVLRDGVLLAAIGLAFGLPAALVLSRFLESLVFGISTADPATFVAVPVTLLAVAALGAFLPAWRATRVDPVWAMKAE
ncbi:MAG TPA: ABC transporter permease [Longimicrobiales bacterium]|nr:ABC transporter permease [Longimicrobiales bacterium]